MLYVFEDFALDTARRELRRGAALVPVEPQIFDLIACLITNRERVVSKEDLLATVWKGRIVSESTLSSAINTARTAIGDNGEEQRLIRTLPRKGFRFVGTVAEASAAAPLTKAGSADEPVPAASEEHGRSTSAEPSGVVPTPAAASRSAGLASRRIVLAAIGAGLVAIALALWFLWPGTDRPSRAPAVAARQTFDASVVPLIDEDARRRLASYPNRPDFKALAITGEGMFVADGQADAEAAKEDALRRCNARTKRQCRLYAVGMEVVWSPAALPLAEPGELRVEPLGIPLVPDDIPTLDRDRRDRIARMHMQAPDHRALAMTAGGAWTIHSRPTRAIAVRLAVERCSEYWQRPCLVLAVDGQLTMQIPKSRQVIGMFLPSWHGELSSEDRERVGTIYQGAEWRALARGRNGSWHAVAGAPSEQAAVADALKACAEADQECRLYAIGNFRVLGD